MRNDTETLSVNQNLIMEIWDFLLESVLWPPLAKPDIHINPILNLNSKEGRRLVEYKKKKPVNPFWSSKPFQLCYLLEEILPPKGKITTCVVGVLLWITKKTKIFKLPWSNQEIGFMVNNWLAALEHCEDEGWISSCSRSKAQIHYLITCTGGLAS